MTDDILKKINDKTLKVAVVGLGYVGLPLAVQKALSGYKTIGFDVNKERVKKVNFSDSYIRDVNNESLLEVTKNKTLVATNDFSYISCVDFITICVPTPLDKFKQPDLSFIMSASIEVGKYLQKGSVVVLESTTYPGTTRELVLPLLESNSGLECGVDFFLGFASERVDPGNKIYKTKNTPKVIGGIGNDAGLVIETFYKKVLSSSIFKASKPEVAEMSKLLENIYRSVNIALINEIAIICKDMNINIWEVIEAAKTKPYGFQPFYPGGGVGGHCIPLDPSYLVWKASEYGSNTAMIELAQKQNEIMPKYCVERIIKILNTEKKAVNGAKILIVGMAYKQDVDDIRESPAVKISEKLLKLGARVHYYDKLIHTVIINDVKYYSLDELDEEVLSDADLVVVATSHSDIDYNFLAQKSKKIFDIKNALKSIIKRDNIEVL